MQCGRNVIRSAGFVSCVGCNPEARERLLQEMEEEARKRADIAEAEGYRLKGLLLHMEHVVGTMRSQTSEEKERLKLEHQRLQTMQSSLETERTAMQLRAQEELGILKQKMKDVSMRCTRVWLPCVCLIG
jgi:hypothetical protein